MTLDTLIQNYEGALSEQELESAGTTAWGHLTQQTMGRIQDVEWNEDPELSEAVGICFRELVEKIQSIRSRRGLTRETVGDWTRTYASGGEDRLDENCREIIRRFLGETALLYRGWS